MLSLGFLFWKAKSVGFGQDSASSFGEQVLRGLSALAHLIARHIEKTTQTPAEEAAGELRHYASPDEENLTLEGPRSAYRAEGGNRAGTGFPRAGDERCKVRRASRCGGPAEGSLGAHR